jgi:hypothetical protein
MHTNTLRIFFAPNCRPGLRKFEHRTGNSPFRNSLKLQDSVNVRYAGMKLSLAQFDNNHIKAESKAKIR